MGNSTKSSELELGHVSGIFGVRGEVRLFLHNVQSHLLNGLAEVVLVSPDGTRRPVRMSARPGAGKRILGRIEGVDSRDGAQALMGWQIVMERDALPALDDDEYYLWQLEGARVYVDGEVVGRIGAIHADGPVEIFEIATPGGDSWFVPSTEQFVDRVDVQEATVHLHAAAIAIEE